jgi:hypothetical protein
MGFRDFWEATGEAGCLGNPSTEEYRFAGLSYQFFERGQLWWDAQHGVRMVDVGRKLAVREKLNLAAVGPGFRPTCSEALFVPPTPAPVPKVQPDPNAERWIEINLSTQHLIAWQGDIAVLESYVSTGRPGFETPTGTFHILSKLESQTLSGVIDGELYEGAGRALGHVLH